MKWNLIVTITFSSALPISQFIIFKDGFTFSLLFRYKILLLSHMPLV